MGGHHDRWQQCNGNLNDLLFELIQEGKLELLGLPATGVILPFLTTREGIEAQIRTGRKILVDLFGIKTNGFWFPGGAFAPRLDLVLKDVSFLYSFIDEETVLSADPPPHSKGLPIQTPNGLLFFPIHEQLSESFVHDETKAFSLLLTNEVKAVAKLKNHATVTIAVELHDFLIKRAVLREISYLADEGFIELSREKHSFAGEAEITRLCSSFLKEPEEKLLVGHVDLLSEHIRMERKLQKLKGISKNSEEMRVYKQMYREWMMLSAGLVSNQSSNKELAEGYVDHFRKLYSILLGALDREILLKRESELIWLNGLQIMDGLIERQEKRESQQKILVLTWEFPPHIVGGLARHVYGLTRSLSKKGYELHVITAGQESLAQEEKMDGVYVYRVKPLNAMEKNFLVWVSGLNIAMVEKAVELSSMHCFACIHAHDWLVGAAASVLKENLSIPLVTTIHATEFGRNNGIYTEIQQFIHEKEKKLVGQSDQLIVCSDYMEDEVQRLFHPSIKKLNIIPNGIDSELNKRVGHRNLLAHIPIDHNRKMIFSIGRMVQEKGFDTLIEAAAIVKKKGLDVYFIIAGKGPLLEEYRRKVSQLELADSVFFIGFIEDDKRNRLLELCEMAVFPSRYEPFGIVALESMKAGKPTIVSNTGGLKGIVQHLKTGLLMIPGNTDSLIEQIMCILNDCHLAKELGENGKKMVDSLFSWNRIAEETKRVFEEVIMNEKLEGGRNERKK